MWLYVGRKVGVTGFLNELKRPRWPRLEAETTSWGEDEVFMFLWGEGCKRLYKVITNVELTGECGPAQRQTESIDIV
jgi:hypothetical protein